MPEKKPVLLVPCCSPLHGDLLQAACNTHSDRIRIVSGSTAATVRTGLCSVNNDACYETIASVGGLLTAYDDLGAPACEVVVPQLCADCRSMDTAAFAGRSFAKARNAEIGVVDATALLRATASEGGARLQCRIGLALWSGDIVMQSLRLMRAGASEHVREQAGEMQRAWMRHARAVVEANDLSAFSRFCEQVTAEAFEVSCGEAEYAPEVVLVGSAPVLYDSHMNAGAIAQLEREGCRVSLPTLAGYVRWGMEGVAQETELGLQLGRLGAIVRDLGLPLRRLATRARLRSSVAGVIPESLRYGDGWRIAARIALEADQGVRDFVYVSTFGCLSGHVMGKGVLRWTRGLASDIHVSAIEYDPGTSAANQLNRIKLIASLARESVVGDGAVMSAGAGTWL